MNDRSIEIEIKKFTIRQKVARIALYSYCMPRLAAPARFFFCRNQCRGNSYIYNAVKKTLTKAANPVRNFISNGARVAKEKGPERNFREGPLILRGGDD